MSDPASIDQQIKRAHQVFKEQREEIELLKFQLEQFKTGVRIFKCSNCGDSVGPVYNVYLMQENEALKHKLDLIRKYCDPYLEHMWAARIAGIIEDKEFREVKKL